MRKKGFWFFTILLALLFFVILFAPVIKAILSVFGIDIDAVMLTENAKYCLEKAAPIATSDYIVMGGVGMMEMYKNPPKAQEETQEEKSEENNIQ